jgi:hypothetical protein
VAAAKIAAMSTMSVTLPFHWEGAAPRCEEGPCPAVLNGGGRKVDGGPPLLSAKTPEGTGPVELASFGGRPASTRWRLLTASSGPGARWSRLELEPITGRSHQLRVHLAWLGMPIVGGSSDMQKNNLASLWKL